MNNNKLRGMMIYNGFTTKSLAQVLGLSESQMRRRIRGEVEFTVGEIRDCCLALHLDHDQIMEIFFPHSAE